MALIDTNGLYGEPRFYTAATKNGLRAMIGAELKLDETTNNHLATSQHERTLTVLVESRTGYRNLCRLLTAGALKHPKGEARYTWELVEKHAEGLHCLTRDDDRTIDKINGIFKGRTHVELQRHFVREEEHHNIRLVDLARRMRLPLVATNGVRYARPEEKDLHDVLTCIREGQHVDSAGRLARHQPRAAHQERRGDVPPVP